MKREILTGLIHGALLGLMLIGVFLASYGIVAYVAAIQQAEYDATDAPPIRSGMVLLTDHGTGCQYLAHRFGGLVARLSGEGKQIGCTP